ncbi:RecA/RadA recombinase [Streptomonospora nanhaiensis]|uniref:RecA/RadA recombinase n=1 Tax=Streptomonospora nanhaiensis TaxID=1323731 RepID=A0A853BVL2_9ACTN|nr:type IV secretion system DNA-binding domain-containing protein [Streptomonospora nanhaiensis]NYI98252.1 RecA/RadA recombinase [Streptomonospora nanhaiensis]
MVIAVPPDAEALVAAAPLAGAGALACAGAYTAAVFAARWLRYRIQQPDARLIDVLPPPEAALEGAHAFWAHCLGLLKPRWQRLLRQPHLAWEYTASAAGVRIQIWVPGTVPPGVVERAVAAAWPGATTHTRHPAPAISPGAHATGGWLHLARNDAYPLRTRFGEDPLRGLLGALTDLGADQRVCVRVCARPATGWRVRRARLTAARLRGAATTLLAEVVSTKGRTGGRAWPDTGDDVRAILTKAQSPRLACQISYLLTTDRPTPQAREELRGRAHGVAASFAAFTSGTNHLHRRPMAAPELWVRHRYLARGYLLSVEELGAVAHLPTDTAVPGLRRAGARRIAPAPAVPVGGENTRVLGDADAGTPRPIAVGVAEARQHTHILGKTGSGKSTLLANLVLQDADAGRAALVIDPRGDLVNDILARLPEEAADRVVLFDPDDRAAPPRLNLLQGGDPDFTADSVVGIFRRIYQQSWGPRTDDILRAAVLTLTRARDPHLTLGEVPMLLADDGFRGELLARVGPRQPALAGFWRWYDTLLSSAQATVTAPVLNKLRTALLRPWVSQVIASGPSTVDLGGVFDSGGLVLMRLPKGVLGEDTASLIGSMALAATWQAVTARVTRPEAERPDLGAYIDECHNFLNLPGSLADMLAEARGYRLGLTLAHQALDQLPDTLRQGLSANARTKVYFTSSPDDAARLEAHTRPELLAHDLAHLGAYQTAVRPLVGAREQPAATMRTRPLPPLVPGRAAHVRRAARRHSADRAHAYTEEDLDL